MESVGVGGFHLPWLWKIIANSSVGGEDGSSAIKTILKLLLLEIKVKKITQNNSLFSSLSFNKFTLP